MEQILQPQKKHFFYSFTFICLKANTVKDYSQFDKHKCLLTKKNDTDNQLKHILSLPPRQLKRIFCINRIYKSSFLCVQTRHRLLETKKSGLPFGQPTFQYLFIKMVYLVFTNFLLLINSCLSFKSEMKYTLEARFEASNWNEFNPLLTSILSLYSILPVISITSIVRLD